MIFVFENFAESRLVEGIDLDDTVLRLPPSDAAKWPQPETAQQRASVVLYDGVQAPEVVWIVTNPGTGQVTVERGMEGSGAKSWMAGTAAINTPTKVSLSYLASGGADSWHQELLDLISGNYAAIGQEINLRVTGDSALAQLITTVETAVAGNQASVQVLQTAFSDLDSAIAEFAVLVDAQAADAVAKATQSLNASVQNGTAIATLQTFVETAVGDNAATFANRIEAFTDFDEAQVIVNTNIDARVGAAEAGLSAEVLVRATQYDAQVINNTSQNAAIGTNAAAITTEQTTRATADTALATRATNLEAEVTDARGGQASVAARINSVESVAATATSAVATRTTNLEAEVTAARQGQASVSARITQVETVAASATSAVATRATTLESQMAGSTASFINSRIATEEGVRSSADTTLASRATTLESQMANTAGSGLQSRISTEESTRASADTTLANRSTTLESQMTGATASFINSRIATEETTRASADTTLAARSTVLESQMAGSTSSFINSRIATEETTRTSADTALASRTSVLEVKGGGSNLATRSQLFTAGDIAAWVGGNAGVPSFTYAVETGAGWAPIGEKALRLTGTVGGSNYAEVSQEAISLPAGTRVCLSSYQYGSATNIESLLYCYNSAGGYVGLIQTGSFSGGTYGPVISDWTRRTAFGTTPANTAYGLLTHRIYANPTGGAPFALFLRPMVSLATATQTEPPPWSPAAVEARLTVTESVSLDAQGKANSIFGVTQDVNGYLSGFGSVNTGNYATFVILADKFGIRDPAGTNLVEYIAGTWRITDAATGTRTRYGKPFGGAEKLVWWTGPAATAIDSETKANADVYVSMVAPRFGGGAVPGAIFAATANYGVRTQTRAGAGSATTGTVTVAPTNNTGAVSYQWSRIPGGSTALSATASTSATTAFTGTVNVGQTIEAGFQWSATDAGSGKVVTGIVYAAITETS